MVSGVGLEATLTSMYIIDYNDSTPVDLPEYFNSTTLNFLHTFSSSGVYYVNFTVHNLVDVKTEIVMVKKIS